MRICISRKLARGKKGGGVRHSSKSLMIRVCESRGEGIEKQKKKKKNERRNIYLDQQQ